MSSVCRPSVAEGKRKAGEPTRARILMAEDEPAVAAIMREDLSDAGFEVVPARDGAEALERLLDARFDLLLTDVRMPRLDGVELVRRLRRTGSSLPIVVLSGFMTVADFGALLALGVPRAAILEKPVTLTRLQDTIRSILSDGGYGAC